jgi:hypothetical protein
MDCYSSDFQIDLDVKFSEEMVDQHCKLDYGMYFRMFNKVSGTFSIPFNYEKVTTRFVMTPYEKAVILDQKFYGTHIRDYFK